MRKTGMMLLGLALIASFAFVAKPVAELEWETDYEAAVRKAKKENKKLLLNFTGSDWCGWCIRLDREVFSKEQFVDYAKKNLVCVKLDFPRSKQLSAEEAKQNQQLASKHGVMGFPTILIVNADNEDVLLKTGYQRGGPESYIAHLKPYVNAKN